MGEVCKCASAIWTLSGVGFWGRLAWHHNNKDKILSLDLLHGPGSGVVTINHGAEAKNQRLARLCGEWSAGLSLTLEGTERTMSTPAECTCLHPQPSQALTPCPHQLTYALLFIQAVRYHFWGWEHNYNRRIATTLTRVAEKIFPNFKERLKKHAFFHLLCITIFLYYLSE